MRKSEYLEKKEKELEEILNNNTLQNFSNQLFAKKITDFDFKFSEDYLWRHALYLSSKGRLILEYDSKNEIAIESIRTAAEIYENLYYVSTKYDKKYSILLASLCYDISGYQANAICLMNELLNTSGFYNLNNHEKNSFDHVLNYENLILKTLQLFLNKKIYLIDDEIKYFKEKTLKVKAELPYYDDLLYYYLDFLELLNEFILTGDEINYLDSFDNCYKDSICSGNVLISHILGLLKVRMCLFKKQNVWDVIKTQNKLPHKIWQNYIKLLVSDIYDDNKIKIKESRNSIFEFWKSQLIAIEKGIISNTDNFVIQMPTSTGKTLIAELTIINSLIENPGSKCIYIAPFRSLTYEIEETLSKRLENLGWKVSRATGSYELDNFQYFWIEYADVIVATPEKIDLLYRNNPDFFEDVSIVVIDEGHLIGEKGSRSSLLEFLIIKLKIKLGEMSKFLFISAVIPEYSSKELSKWLSGNQRNVISSPTILGKEWQPTRKLFGFFEWYPKKEAGQIVYHIGKNRPYLSNIIKSEFYGNTKFPNKKNSSFKFETAASLAYKLIDEGNILIFISRPDWVRYMGTHFLKLIELKDEYNVQKNQFRKRRLVSIEIAEKWLEKDDIVIKCLKRGLGLHYGSLSEELKKSIEKDFREKRLDVLIATNTIAQGVNFPIKTVIVHSLIRNYQKQTKVSNHDFWNIIGRAGRAGKETEGQVIFLKFEDEDDDLFKEYLDKDNLKIVESNLIPLIKILQKRLHPLHRKKIDNELRLLIEPYFLNILMEESVNSDDEKLIKEMIGNSLFKIQADNQRLIIDPLKKRLIKIASYYRSKIEDDDLRKIYAKNGLYLFSSELISNFIIDNMDDIQNSNQNDDIFGILRIIMHILPSIHEMQGGKLKKDVIERNLESLYFFTCKWISGSPIKELSDYWENLFYNEKKLKKKMQIFINDYLEYRYPWGISVFLDILNYHLKKESKTNKYILSEKIKHIPVFVKYGLEDNIACIGKTIGLKTRESCIILSKHYKGDLNFNEFVKWVSMIEFKNIDSFNISEMEKVNLYEIIIKLNNETMDVEKLKLFEYWVQEIQHEKHGKLISAEINVGDSLTLERDYRNTYDLYSIKMSYDDNIIGYIPRSISKAFSVEMDLNKTVFMAKIIDKQEKDDFFELKFKIEN